jgi:Putative DNA-binding domain
MDAGFIQDVLLRGVETRSVEFKRSLDFREKVTKVKVAKGCIGLANTRDGGYFILGMEKSATDKHDPRGMEADHLTGYGQDDVASAVMSYAEPAIALTVHSVVITAEPLLKAMTFIVIEVKEFTDVPIICKKTHSDEGVLEGGLYIRSLDGYGTRQIKTEFEMRELIELATEKRLRHLMRTVSAAGGEIVPIGSPDESAKAFAKQAEDFHA